MDQELRESKDNKFIPMTSITSRTGQEVANEPINLGGNIQTLPGDNSVPALEDWFWIHTPGHGVMMAHEELSQGLSKLVKQFEQIAIPDYGRYVNEKNIKH